ARGLAAQHPRIRHRAAERDLPAGPLLAEARAASARQPLRDPYLHAEAGRHSRYHRPLEHPDRRAHQTVAPGRRLVFRARRAQPLVPHLGLQGCCRAFRGPRTCPQRRRLAAAWRAAWRYLEAGEHAGRPGILLAAALSLEPGWFPDTQTEASPTGPGSPGA